MREQHVRPVPHDDPPRVDIIEAVPEPHVLLSREEPCLFWGLRALRRVTAAKLLIGLRQGQVRVPQGHGRVMGEVPLRALPHPWKLAEIPCIIKKPLNKEVFFPYSYGPVSLLISL